MQRKSIFVVEGDTNIIKALQNEVSKTDDLFIIGTASNGKDALIQLKTLQNVDVIITELVLPIMDGFNLLTELNTFINKEKRPQIIVTSGLVNQNILNMISTLGASNFLLKPYEASSLLTMIKEQSKTKDDVKLSDSLKLEKHIMLRQIIITAAFSMLMACPAMAQFTYGTTGLLHMPTADMQPDKTFMFGGGRLNKQATPSRWSFLCTRSP